MAAITRADVERVARLARLQLTEAEQAAVTLDLDSILRYVEMLSQVDTRDVEPTTTVIPMSSVMREDQVRPGLSQAEALANAPDPVDGCFRVPRILED
jgi:aspartyl-tRNA(Asn)/glutamyl-tRNA(Gln) amidotransferase subunit C